MSDYRCFSLGRCWEEAVKERVISSGSQKGVFPRVEPVLTGNLAQHRLSEATSSSLSAMLVNIMCESTFVFGKFLVCVDSLK